MTLAELMVELLAARRESAATRQEIACALDIMAQAIVGLARGGHGGHGGNGGGAHRPKGLSSYQDFLKTHPPTFAPSDEPLEAEHWLRTMEQKFWLLGVADEQKKFSTAFREFFSPVGVINQKVTEFLELRQGNRTVMEYVNKFNHLAQYAGSQVDTDDRKRECFFRGLAPLLQEKLYTVNYQTFGALMNTDIAIEGFQQQSQADWKRKWVVVGSSSHPHTQKI
ncbi:uncharacterized protein [Miscanthus floridulus]|uniref:uncharacterized protein n=1 Tax=Miscanthus floridulus TaxID=154761 RepID=UPI00345AFDAB